MLSYSCAIIIVVIKMKTNRLLEITIILLNKGTVTAKELAGRFGVSTRTIYRDIEVLSLSGVPVYMTQGSGGGISLLENYALNKTLLTEQESESLLLALQTLQVTKYPEVDMILDKIGAVFKKKQNPNWVEIDFTPWGSSPNEQNKFRDIKRAILQRNVIRFDYVNADGRRSHRFVEPNKLVYKGNSWYLSAYCRERKDYRIFRISRVKNVEVTTEEFVTREMPRLQNEEMMGMMPKLIQLKLRFQPQVLNRIYDDFDDSFIVKNPDGTFDIEVAFPEDEWVYGYLMSYGGNVEVLEPEHVRVTIAGRLRQALQYYRDSSV